MGSNAWTVASQPAGQAQHPHPSVLPLLPPPQPVRQAIREASREAIRERECVRCPHCNLVQFATVDGICRRCRQSFDKPVAVDDIYVASPSSSSSSLSFVASHPRQPVLFSFERSLPIILHWLRVRRGMSQRDVAHRLIGGNIEAKRIWIGRIEAGRVLPNLCSLGRMARVLGVDVAGVVKMCEILMSS